MRSKRFPQSYFAAESWLSMKQNISELSGTFASYLRMWSIICGRVLPFVYGLLATAGVRKSRTAKLNGKA